MALVIGSLSDDVLNGTLDEDVLVGLSGNDELNGADGADRLSGGAGDDALRGGTGGERTPRLLAGANPGMEIAVNGGDVADYSDAPTGVIVNLGLAGSQNTGHGLDVLTGIEDLWGGTGADVLTGDGFGNMLFGGDGDDQLFGGGGNDVLIGSVGEDVLHGGDGNDILRAGSLALGFNADGGDDELFGEAGADELLGSAGADALDGGDGDDVLWGGAGADRHMGGSGDDVITAGFGDIEVDGGDDNDRIVLEGLASGEAQLLSLVEGQDGDDVFDIIGDITTLTAALIVEGGNGHDTLIFVASPGITGPIVVDVDAAPGTPGLHLIGVEAIASPDLQLDFSGGSLSETVTGSHLNDVLRGAGGDDTLIGVNGDDILRGGEGEDNLVGGSGNDHLYGGAGADLIQGGGGFDLVRYDDASEGVVVSLLYQAGHSGGALGDFYSSIEGVVGSMFNDVIRGTSQRDLLYGNDGDDRIWGSNLFGPDEADRFDELDGGAGDDLLYSAGESNRLTGGSGFDTATFEQVSQSVVIRVENALYTSIESVIGTIQNDILIGDQDGNRLDGGGGDDTLYDGDGDDELFGEIGRDHLYSRGGVDILNGGHGYDLARFDFARSSGVTADLSAGSTSDGGQLIAIEGLVGSLYDDELLGNGGDNVIYGQSGDDEMTGGGGADDLYGQAGADTFFFHAGSGQDRMFDFDPDGIDHDLIAIQNNINGSGIVDFATLMAHVEDDLNGVTIDLGNASSISLYGVEISSLSSDLFAFI